MKVVLLAAGRSKRLKPIEDKNFLEFLGKPLIEHQIRQLIKAGLKEIFVIGGAHNLSKLSEVCERFSSGATVKLLEQKKLEDGMAGAIMTAEKQVGKEAILVVSANDIVDVEGYKKLIDAAKDRAFESFLLAKKVEQYFPGGYLKLAKNGSISGIAEKPGAGNEPSDLVNLVVHFHRRSDLLFEALHRTKSARDDHYEAALDTLMKADIKMKAIVYENFWKPIKYPWDVLTVMDHFLEKMAGNYRAEASKITQAYDVEIAPSATIRGDVTLEEGVRILDNAVIVGPAYIGKNTVVATNTLVRNSIVGENCVVGFGTEIARSFVGDHVWTHSNYIGDSIIGNDCSFGAGTVTGNLRLDEGDIHVMIQDEKINSGRNKFGVVMGQHVRCGINTSFMPGVKIGNNCFIGAGIVVGDDVPDQKLVYAKTELIMKENKAVIDRAKRGEMKGKLG